MGIKEIKELLAGLELLGVAAKKIAADGKVGVDDLAHLLDVAKKAEVLLAAIKDIDKIDDEIKALDQAEIIELVSAVLALVKKIKEA